MLNILFFTIIGFLVGLGLVMYKRKIEPGEILGATFLGVFAAVVFKIIKEISRNQRRKRHF